MRIKREAEEAAKARQDAAKREKENAKRALKRERKQLQNYGKQFNYFSSSEAEHVARMADLDRLCELLTIDEYEIRPGEKKTYSTIVPFSPQTDWRSSTRRWNSQSTV